MENNIKFLNLKSIGNFAVFCTIIYTPIAFVGFIAFLAGEFSLFTVNQTYQYCRNGDSTCVYSILVYLYLICLPYTLYRFIRWIGAKLFDFVWHK